MKKGSETELSHYTLGHTATYDPADNKLRLYPAHRLDKEDYDKVKASGFSWAAKQECFVAPMWTPAREDLLIEMCGEVGDEDTSLVERAEQRAARFSDYKHNRVQDAQRAEQAVKAIADGIPLGQPILVGHHSEKRARKDAEKIENGMRKSVQMWKTARYWEDRAQGALAHAKYKNAPGVRARRIKTLQAELRGHERDKKMAQDRLQMWNDIEGKPKQLTDALVYDTFSYDFYRKVEQGEVPLEEAQKKALRSLPNYIAHYDRWIDHLTNRLRYETMLLEEQGAADLIAPKARPKQLPLLNDPRRTARAATDTTLKGDTYGNTNTGRTQRAYRGV